MKRLPVDVAHEVALMTQKLTKGIKVEAWHVDTAFKIVQANLLADSIAWIQFMRGVRA